MKTPKQPGILGRMKRLEQRVRAVGRRVNTFATSAGDSIGELTGKFEELSREVTKLKSRVMSLDLWRHRMGGKNLTPPPETDD